MLEQIASALYEAKLRPYYFQINRSSERAGTNFNTNNNSIATFHPDLHGKAHNSNPYRNGLKIGFEFRYAPLMYFDVPYTHHRYNDYYYVKI